MKPTFGLLVVWVFATILLCSIARIPLQRIVTALETVQTTTRYQVLGTR